MDSEKGEKTVIGGQQYAYGAIPEKEKKEPVEQKKSTDLCKKWFPTGLKPELREMFKLAWPMILTMFSQNFVPAVAVMFSGHLGRTALNAVSLANSVINVTGLSVGMGLATACDTLFSQSYGSNNKKKVGQYLQKALLIIIVACIPCWAIHLNTESILRLLGQEQETSRLSGRYLMFFMPALLFNFAFQVLSKYIQNQNIVIPNVVIGLIGVATNAVLHYVFLYVLNLGTDGSAVCQVIANFMVCFLTLLYILVTGVYHDTWDGWSTDCLREWNLVLKLAIPGMLMICLEWWCFEIGTLVSGIIGEGVQLGAQSIMFQLEALGFMIPMGISIAVSIRVGQHLGAGSPDGAKTACRVSLLMGVICSLVIGILFMALRFFIPRLFSDDTAVVNTAAGVLPVLGLFTILDGIAGINGGILRGCGRQVVGAVSIFIGLYVVALPMGIPLLLFTSLQVAGLWWAYVCGMAFEAILLTSLVVTTNWQLEAEQAQIRAGIVEEVYTEDEDLVSQDEEAPSIGKVPESKKSSVARSIIPEAGEQSDTVDETTELLGPRRLPRTTHYTSDDVNKVAPSARRFSSPASSAVRRISSAGGGLAGPAHLTRRYSSSRFVNLLHGRRFSHLPPPQKKISLPDMNRRYSSPYISPVREIVVDTELEKEPVWKVILLRSLVIMAAVAILVAGAIISVYFRFPYELPVDIVTSTIVESERMTSQTPNLVEGI